MKPIHKFNNGRGAMLCNICRTIISTGPATKELYCEKCKPKQETAVEFAVKKLEQLIPSENKVVIRAILRLAKEMEKKQLREAFKQSRQALIFEKDIPPVYESFEEWFEQFKNK